MAVWRQEKSKLRSSDFSLSNYSYAPVEGDLELVNFSIDEDKDDLIPMIIIFSELVFDYNLNINFAHLS